MTATVTLRPMTAQEYDDYRTYAIPMYAGDLVRARGMAPEEAHKNSVETFAATLDEALAPDRSWLFRVLTSSGEPAGWLWLGPHPFRLDAAFVYDIEIDETHQGQGLGRATMLAAEEVARKAGLTTLTLNVFGWNQQAEGLYRSLGYEVDATTMSKSLTQEKP
jgi:ribosomal protein S18 acetylase RimI-like enzyme